MKLYCNKDLSQLEGFHDRIYRDFVEELRWDKRYPFLHYPEEYDGQDIVKLCCTQHSKVIDWEETISDYQRKKITQSWVDFLSCNELPLKVVQFCTITPQSIFDAVCMQKSIESLRIKSLHGKNVEKIVNLRSLKRLFLEAAVSLEDISPIGELEQLEVLILGSTKKITDYSALGKLKRLKVLGICSYQIWDDVMHMDDDAFISEMECLEYLDISDVKIKNRTYLSGEHVKDMEFACFRMD